MLEELATVQSNKISLSRNGLQLTSLNDMWRFSQYVVKSGFAPKGMEKPESILIAVEMGFEIGLSPMAALQNTAVVNGRPTIYGDAALALVRGSGLLEEYKEEKIGKKGTDEFGYRVSAKRKGDPSVYVEEFTVADAKQASLWGKSGPWSTYPERMLKFRARGFLLRDAFGDVLKGMRTFEEARDFVDADFEVVETQKKAQKLFKKRDVSSIEGDNPPTATGEARESTPTETNPADDNPSGDENRNPLDILAEKLDAEGLTQAQLISWAKKQTGILVGGTRLDELGATKILNAWNTVKGFIAREDSGDDI